MFWVIQVQIYFTVSLVLWAIPVLAAFSDVTVSSGIHLDGGIAYGAAWGDYDGDGDEDIFVARRGLKGKKASSLYRNDGRGNFTDLTPINFFEGGPIEAWGAAWGDYDNDGDLDLYVSRRTGEKFPNILYRNNGNSTFTNVTGETGVGGGSSKPSRTASWADYDQDGWLDLYVANNGVIEGTGVQDFLFHNITDPSGKRVFNNVATRGKIKVDSGNALSYTGLWSDYDNDGDLDLFVALDFHGLELFRNEGGWPSGSITRITEQAFPDQLVDSLGPPTSAIHCIRNSDGHYVDQTQQGHVHCLRDEPTTGFVHPSYGALPYNAMGICAGDYNNDGFIDYYVTNFVADDYQRAASIGDDHGKLESTLWHNKGDGTFTERARLAGLNPLKTGHPPTDEMRDPNGTVLFSFQKHENVEWGCNFFDYDNDGYLDLYVVAGNPPGLNEPSISQRDTLYRNNGDGTFTETTAAEIPAGSGDGSSSDGEASGFGSAVADMDDDGDLDLFVANNTFGSSRLYRNDQNTGHSWLKIKLIGMVQRFGIGARVEVTAGPLKQIREVRAGGGYLSMDSLVQHFGLGSETLVNEIRILWPSGRLSIVLNQPANQTFVIRESCASDRADHIPPTVPAELTVTTAGDGQLDLKWRGSTDRTCLLGYRLYREEVQIGSASTTTYSDSGLSPSTYCYKVTAVDMAGNESGPGNEACATVHPDRTPPSRPGHLGARVFSPSQVHLTWQAAIDKVGVVNYQIYRDGLMIEKITAPTYLDIHLKMNTIYCYTVRAVDTAGNVSVPSEKSCAKPYDFTVPTTPTGLTSRVKATKIHLRWDSSTDDVNVAVYHVYRDGVLVGESSNTNFRDKALSPDTTYRYIVTALDSTGNISIPSEVLEVKTGQETEGCIIMTAAFGSPLEPHVQLLREFRSRFLLTSSAGRVIVNLYDRYSPPLARIIEPLESMRVLVRFMLWPFVGLAWLALKFRLGLEAWMMSIFVMGYIWNKYRTV